MSKKKSTQLWRHEIDKLINFTDKKPFTDDGRIKFQPDK